MNQESLLKKLREAFRIEAQERLMSLSTGLLELEKEPASEEEKTLLEVLFREAHSLKGAARSVSYTEIESLCQSMEDVFTAVRKSESSLSREILDLMHKAIDAIETFLSSIKDSAAADLSLTFKDLNKRLHEVQTQGNMTAGSEEKARNKADLLSRKPSSGQKRTVRETLPSMKPETAKNGASEKDTPAQPLEKLSVSKRFMSETVRIPSDRLNDLLLKSEEFISVKLNSMQHLENLRDVLKSIETVTRQWADIEPELRSVQSADSGKKGLSSFPERLLQHRETLNQLRENISGLLRHADRENRSLAALVGEHLNSMKMITMLPFSSLLELFPRMVREVSRDLGKQVELAVDGGAIEIDRRILEQIKDPLIHLIRNAIDHGIETPEERQKLGKKSSGTIRIHISPHNGDKVDILVSDDGGGIQLDRVKEKASSLGLVTAKEVQGLEEQEILPLILQSGVSTSPIITDLSGRGLGLAIVQEMVERLGGFLQMETRAGKGAVFRMQLPMTMATFRGDLVRTGKRLFILPSAHMDRTLRVRREAVKTVENKSTIPIDGRAVSLVSLGKVLRIEHKGDAVSGTGFLTVVVLTAGSKQIAFWVDEVVGEQEILVKGLGKQLLRVPNIAGATVLGTGEVVPVLNLRDLIKSTDQMADAATEVATGEDGEKKKGKSILVAEDSITSRMLIKNILEGAGYSVKTAVDGKEAFTTLKAGAFDLVVSDVEMPRMTGFELTEKIRSDQALSDVPVVLVTGLEKREDREKGIDVGANAYIVKSSFDQSNLLEVVDRLT